MGIFDFFRKKEAPQQDVFTNKPVIPTEKLMISQLPALYLHDKNNTYRDIYINKLHSLGIRIEDAQNIFEFECGVIRRYGKNYLLDPNFTVNWFFGLQQPFFQVYPSKKEDILKEKALTISDLCKLIDEAEWHFWNSHERNLSADVWAEICQWRLDGPGAEFAMRYFGMISAEAKVPMDSLAALSSENGAHLNRYKWG